VLVGSSFGTNCVTETLAYDLHPAGIVLIGSSVFGGDIQLSSFLNPETDMSILFSDEGEGDQLHAFISKACFFSDKEDIRILIDDYYKVSTPFRSTLIQTMMSGKHANEIELLQQANVPALFLFGERDNIVNIHYLDKVELPLWNNRIVIFPEAGHLAALDRPEEFNLLLLEFMKELFK
jgi:pimeloyl-ACP methyl ester carboxylesterase